MTIFLTNLPRNKHSYLLIAFLLSVSSFYSCTSTKSITYFQGDGTLDTARLATLASITPPISRIQPDDILAIVVSSLSSESNELFNFANINTVTMSRFPSAVAGGNNSQPLGYLIDADGYTNLPLIGKIKLGSLTNEEAEQQIQEKLGKYLKEVTVNIRNLNRRYSVLGEVVRPGVYNLLNDHTTLPQIISAVGDLTTYGRRDNVMLIRTTNEKREIVKIDLTKRDILNSPYYFIRHDDIIYVEPRPGRITATDRTLQLAPLFLGVTSTLLVILNFIRK
ncbi:ligand-binding protein [Spirosoma sp. KCTC 42546]|uniref:polysaccharide biosynthesis/export family protein n=1 Tax=Spirosoma sp. KCTC 42546 TaxID=2520506 RepID=UPI00115785FB|nr:polysaccharide biosynthesis/export family protein [Spirosoma sp. KCTC 42546]QDK78679.1 ligand-binding protein [Spirosoma sp. KCTC 42546]